MKTKIYALTQPGTEEIKYVGKTNYELKRRLTEHIKTGRKKKKNYKESWISSLLKQNLEPKIILIDEVENSEWEFWEKYWISQFKTWGFNLTNGTDGGISPFVTHLIQATALKKANNKRRRKIIQYDLNGKFIKIWKSVTEAAANNSALRKHISRASKNKKSAGGYMWRYYEKNFNKKIEPYNFDYKNLSGLQKGRDMSRQFSKKDIKYIRANYKNKEKKQIELADEFGVSKISIWNIINKKTYGDW